MEHHSLCTLLLAEDDEDIAFLFLRMFRRFEPAWRIEWARNGSEAVVYCQKAGLPAVVITDLNMPSMNGYEVMAWLRSQPQEPGPMVVVYSSTDDETSRETCLRLGASEFISKATKPQQLQERVRCILLASRSEAMVGGSGADRLAESEETPPGDSFAS